MLFRITMIVALAALGIIGPVALEAREVLPGPIPAQVVSVYDGDTITVRARIWLGQEIETKVRLDGIDAPELRGKCEDEKELAKNARDFLIKLAGDTVMLRNIRYGKYAGRVVAKVFNENGDNLVASLIHAGYGRPYSGGKRQGWCP
jgi:micrococcal nuclease